MLYVEACISTLICVYTSGSSLYYHSDIDTLIDARRKMRTQNPARRFLLFLFSLLALWTPGMARAAETPLSVPPPPHVDLQTQVKATAMKVIPAVVNISSTVLIREQAIVDEGPLFGNLPVPPPHRQYGQGSGVIVTADGYIITNNRHRSQDGCGSSEDRCDGPADDPMGRLRTPGRRRFCAGDRQRRLG